MALTTSAEDRLRRRRAATFSEAARSLADWHDSHLGSALASHEGQEKSTRSGVVREKLGPPTATPQG